jgi:microcin C transport system substrate-binding protein
MGLRKNFTLRSAASADVSDASSGVSAGEWTRLTRRQTLLLSTLAALQAFGIDRRALANQDRETHGLSAFGDLKYPADFKHFDFVNPDAPKGGTFSQIGASRVFNQNFVTFNSLNSYIARGDAALGIELTFATLMTRAEDESDALYGLAARTVRISGDRLTYKFLLRPQAQFHDGTKLTAHDAAFTLVTLKEKGHPVIKQFMRDFVTAEAEDDATVVLRFKPGYARDVPLLIAGLPIFSRAYYSSRPFDETTLTPPLGSGPYKVGRLEPGRYIEYERVKDWWGAKLPVVVGRHNFDVVRYEFYRDRGVAFEGFTGKNYLFREEFTSRIWATQYDFPAVRDGRVKREVLPDQTPSGAQGWFINTRRPQFKDRRVREALVYAFDFEWTNANLMYGSYERTHSLFQNSDMMASGKPEGAELALLEPLRSKLPPEVFDQVFVPPVSDKSGHDRALLRKASQLLQDAGYVIKDGKRVGPNGEKINIEFLMDEPSTQAHHAPFIKNLATIGIDATFRVVDPVQFRARVEEFDFDITVQGFRFSTTPGESLRNYLSSQAASIKGSQNLAGISDPAIDLLIDKVIAAETRADLVIATRTLDRVFRAGHYWIPHWYKPAHWIAYWDVFNRPATKPRYARGAPDTWWYDAEKASKLEKAG